MDAIIVMNDTGFATDGQSFFSGANCYTKSAFLDADYVNALKQHGKDQAKVIVEKLNTIKS